MLNSKKDTIQIIQIQAIMNFWLACQNIQKFDLIEMAFKGTESDPMIVHLFKLFDSVKFNVFDFIGKLDTKKRGVFINHIMTHYNGISIDTVKEQYMANVKLSEPEPKAWSVVLEGSNDYLAKHHRTALINRFSKWDWSVRPKGTEVCIEHIKAEIFFKITAITSSTVYLKFTQIIHQQITPTHEQ